MSGHHTQHHGHNIRDLHPYPEWLRLGYQVRKGEVAFYRQEISHECGSVPLFCECQVAKKEECNMANLQVKYDETEKQARPISIWHKHKQECLLTITTIGACNLIQALQEALEYHKELARRCPEQETWEVRD